ncbi:MAG: hypothetical protein ACT4NY_19315 [Pseudonocardiales bacterium]
MLVLSHEQLTALAAAIERGDLNTAQSELLARLVLEIGTAVLVWPRVAHRCPSDRGCVAVAWGVAAETFGALVAAISPGAT